MTEFKTIDLSMFAKSKDPFVVSCYKKLHGKTAEIIKPHDALEIFWVCLIDGQDELIHEDWIKW